MSFEREIAERMRRARPRVESSPPSFAAVRALIEQSQEDSCRSRRFHWPRRLGVLFALGALTLAGCAWGASRLLSGSPVVPAFAWVQAKPTVGLGVPLPSSLPVLGLRAADPAGGPPWGMRIIRTTRHQACLQVGRVVDGRLGALGMGYAFHDDGRFHAFSPEDAFGPACVQPDVHGRVFDTVGPNTITADGLPLAENTFERVHCDLPQQHNWGVRCPLSQLRLIAYGLLGPDATELNVRFQGRSFEVKPYGPQGAYLLAFQAPKGTDAGGYFGAQAPNPPTFTVRFADGSSCHLPPANDTDACKPQGIDFASTTKLTAAQLAAPVGVTYSRHASGGQSPFVLTGPRSASASPTTGAGPALIVTFTARVGTPDPLSAYAVEIHRPVVPDCFGAGALVSQEASHTIAAGQSVRILLPLQAACHGRYSGRVFYMALQAGLEQGGEERLLGRMSRRLMGLPRSTDREELEFTVGHFEIDIPAGGHDSPTELREVQGRRIESAPPLMEHTRRTPRAHRFVR
jgi:hypothetical protein